MFAWFRSTANRRPRCAHLGASDAQLAAHSNLRKPASLLDGQAGRSRVGATSRFESARSARNESAHLRIQKATLRRECWGSGRERRRPDSPAFPPEGRPPRAPRVSLRGERKKKRSAFRTPQSHPRLNPTAEPVSVSAILPDISVSLSFELALPQCGQVSIRHSTFFLCSENYSASKP